MNLTMCAIVSAEEISITKILKFKENCAFHEHFNIFLCLLLSFFKSIHIVEQLAAFLKDFVGYLVINMVDFVFFFGTIDTID